MVVETEVADWRRLAQSLHARFLIDAYVDGARFVAAVGEACQDAVPEVRLGASFVDVATRDAELAARISSIAAEHGLTADPTAVSRLEVALDTADLVEL